MWQAEHVQALLKAQGHSVSLLGMTTQGDQILDRSLSKVGGKGLFVKELEVALEEGRANLAVHSLKDVPMDLPEGFDLACVMTREDPRDAFVSNRYAALADLPDGAVVGTSSLRRESQLRARYPHLTIRPLRGNVQTRLNKLDENQFDAIILAAATLGVPVAYDVEVAAGALTSSFLKTRTCFFSSVTLLFSTLVGKKFKNSSAFFSFSKGDNGALVNLFLLIIYTSK